jgi:hypothetical protein
MPVYNVTAYHVVTHVRIARTVVASSAEVALSQSQRLLDFREWQVLDARLAA